MQATEQFRSWVASPAGRRVTPIASLVLVLAGAVVLVSSLFGGSESPPAPPGPPQATRDLERAMAVAKHALVGNHPNSYKRFGVPAAEGEEPELTWNGSDKAVAGEVSIRVAGQTEIVLVTKDASTGIIYCIADVNADEETTKGRVDAKKPAECTGGW